MIPKPRGVVNAAAEIQETEIYIVDAVFDLVSPVLQRFESLLWLQTHSKVSPSPNIETTRHPSVLPSQSFYTEFYLHQLTSGQIMALLSIYKFIVFQSCVAF